MEKVFKTYMLYRGKRPEHLHIFYDVCVPSFVKRSPSETPSHRRWQKCGSGVDRPASCGAGCLRGYQASGSC